MTVPVSPAPPAGAAPQPYTSWARDRWIFEDGGPGGVVILMYHKIDAAPAASGLPGLYVSPAEFDRQMAELAAAGQRCIPYGDALAAIGAGEGGFCLTFDDGFRNVFDHALPILQRRGLRAMLFVVAGLIGATDEWDRAVGEPPLPLMDDAHIRDWLAAGHEIGAHTLTHPHLPALPPDRARAEIFDGKRRLEDRFGVPVRHFCYPYGDFNPAVRALVAEAGYLTAPAAGGPGGFGANRPGAHPLELRRVMACNRPSLARAVARKVARLVRPRLSRRPSSP